MDQNIQELASKLVQEHVICCVSSLIEGLIKVSSELDYKLFADAFDIDIDDLQSLCQRPDYETAARDFIFNDADVVDLESVADEEGCWEDIVAEVAPEVVEDTEEDEDSSTTFYTYAGTDERFKDEDEAKESAIESVMPAIREAVWKITIDYESVCTNHGLDYEYTDVYEHWVVSDWLSRRLAEKGEVIGEVCGLTIWGRCTSGQAISIDGVITEIAKENAK
jgi:hypothetical protein